MDEELAQVISDAIARAINDTVMPHVNATLKQVMDRVEAEAKASMANMRADIYKMALDHKPRDGKDGTHGVNGSNGKDGKDGSNGRDASFLPMPWFKEAAAGHLVTHRGGLFRAKRACETEPGTPAGADDWDLLVKGVYALRTAPTADAATLCVHATYSDGEDVLIGVVPLYALQGTWEEGKAYKYLNVVQFNGCSWTAAKDDPEGQPGDSPDWKLQAKRGDKGKGVKED